MREKVHNYLKAFFDRNYSKVIIGYLVFNLIIIVGIYVFIPKYFNIWLTVSPIILVVLLRNDVYWWFYKLGYLIENKIKKNFNFVSDNNISEEIKMIEKVAHACFEMADSKMGAIISFEVDRPLIEYTKPATQLDAEVSKDLLLSIFQVKSPLHDGGSVISKGRITAAGCFFPITKNTKIKSNYGSRHRAALGISEVTDSLTVLVSEERGSIHLVFDGNISPAIKNKRNFIDLLNDKILK